MGSYYDVDAILTDAQKVPCTFELSVPSLGYLEGNISGEVTRPPRLITSSALLTPRSR
jgi:GINS complex subunit 3